MTGQKKKTLLCHRWLLSIGGPKCRYTRKVTTHAGTVRPCSGTGTATRTLRRRANDVFFEETKKKGGFQKEGEDDDDDETPCSRSL